MEDIMAEDDIVDMFDHYRTNEIVCPYCKEEFENSKELFTEDDINHRVRATCPSCDEDFFIDIEAEIKYTSIKLEEGGRI
jgi:uncharacterized Zn-finger protein